MIAMHSYEKRKLAVELYVSNGYSAKAVKDTLGYPCRTTMYRWYRDFLEKGHVILAE